MAFNKAIFQVIETMKQNKNADIFAELLTENNFNELKRIYIFYLQRRKRRFLMNYYRIIGLTKIIFEKFSIGEMYYEQFKDETKILLFENLLQDDISETNLRKFLEELNRIVRYTKLRDNESSI
ncbi:MAG: hypothetical protein LC115_06575 [Bacteroidia bacterium]|nr:hypothetical protein [Bacteroidia bacterium]